MSNTVKQNQRNAAEKRINEEYYDVNSPHYKDNERYAWAVECIKEQFDEPAAPLDYPNGKEESQGYMWEECVRMTVGPTTMKTVIEKLSEKFTIKRKQ